ncbi:hypothetical protein [Pararhodonellum marinum]|uniref:hypothetical protein n=1 Tax=Pararhodonellum marinum TaxID=2755358 RepID=UPI00188E1D09|nr:hypothetical protein [Pararhodonellum marinum]
MQLIKPPLLLIFMFFLSFTSYCQEDGKIKIRAYDGFIMTGYVDQGGFLNFTGPNANMTKGHSKYVLGMLPSLRFKQDNSTPKNSFITPNLGIGFTYGYKIYAIQIPLYYNPKSATQDGRWHVGLGLGVHLNHMK